jgi:hypothetical protein
MAHFAELDKEKMVTSVVVVKNEVLDPNNEEQSGIEFLSQLYGHGKWVQTSYNGSFRGRYAGIDYTYNEELDEFIAPLDTSDAV